MPEKTVKSRVLADGIVFVQKVFNINKMRQFSYKNYEISPPAGAFVPKLVKLDQNCSRRWRGGWKIIDGELISNTDHTNAQLLVINCLKGLHLLERF